MSRWVVSFLTITSIHITMIPTNISKLSVNRCSTARRVVKSLLIIPVIACVLTCVSCTDETSSPIVDVTPLGDGLKVIGYAVVGAAVLGVLSPKWGQVLHYNIF
jgi:hypothetical protein